MVYRDLCDTGHKALCPGTLTFARLVQGLAQVDNMKLWDGQSSDDEDEPPIPAAEVRAAALAEYPNFD